MRLFVGTRPPILSTKMYVQAVFLDLATGLSVSSRGEVAIYAFGKEGG
jgi:hypothetical protein